MRSQIPGEAQGMKPRAQSGRGQTPRLVHKGGTPGGNPERPSPALSLARLPSCPRSYLGQRPASLYPSALTEGGLSGCERRSRGSSSEAPVWLASAHLPFLLRPPLPAAGMRRGPAGQMPYPDIKHEPGARRHPTATPPHWQVPPCAQVTVSPEVAGGCSSSRKPHQALPPTPTHSGHGGGGRGCCPHCEAHRYSWEWG